MRTDRPSRDLECDTDLLVRQTTRHCAREIDFATSQRVSALPHRARRRTQTERTYRRDERFTLGSPGQTEPLIERGRVVVQPLSERLHAIVRLHVQSRLAQHRDRAMDRPCHVARTIRKRETTRTKFHCQRTVAAQKAVRTHPDVGEDIMLHVGNICGASPFMLAA